MLGGILSILVHQWANLISEDDNYSNTKRQYNLIKIKINKKTVIIIMTYKPPEGKNHRVYTVKSQLDRHDKSVKSI